MAALKETMKASSSDDSRAALKVGMMVDSMDASMDHDWVVQTARWLVSSTVDCLDESMVDEMVDLKVATMVASKVFQKAIHLDEMSAEPTVETMAVSKDAYLAYHLVAS